MNGLNEEQTSFLIANILGDSYLTKNTENYPVRLEIQHSIKQIEYLKWKRDAFISLGFNVGKIYDVSRKYPAYRFSVIFSRDIGKKLRENFYPNGKKSISRHYLNYLNELGLAIWYMDDGSLTIHKEKNGTVCGRECFLSTHSFSEKENKIISRYFSNVWGIVFKVSKDREYYRLKSNATNANLFFDLIRKYVHPTLHYKIDMKYLGSQKNNVPMDISIFGDGGIFHTLT